MKMLKASAVFNTVQQHLAFFKCTVFPYTLPLAMSACKKMLPDRFCSSWLPFVRPSIGNLNPQANIPVVENGLNGAVFASRMLNLMNTFDLPLRGGKQRYTIATCL